MHQAVGIFYVHLGKATSILVEIELSFNVQQAKGVCLCVKSCHTPSLVISDEFLLLTITREVILRFCFYLFHALIDFPIANSGISYLY